MKNYFKISREPAASYYLLKHGLSYQSGVNQSGKLISFGRVGLRLIAKDLKNKGIKNVWIPALVCDVVPKAFEIEGLDVAYYPITESLSPDIDWLDKRQLHGAFLYITYFGLAHTSAELLSWVKKKGLVSIHDNAHGILSKTETGADYSISSIGKIAGLRFGAVVSGKAEFLQMVSKELRGINLKQEVSNLLSALPASIGDFLRPTKNTASDISDEVYPKEFDLLNEQYFATIWTLLKKPKISDERRKAYLALYERFSNNRENFSTFALGTQDVPWVFPVIINKGNRDEWLRRIGECGVEAFYWPDLPKKMIKSDFPGFYSKLIVLPVWKKIDFGVLDQLSATISRAI